MEGQSKGSRGLEAYCKGGQGPRRAVGPSIEEEDEQSLARKKVQQVALDEVAVVLRCVKWSEFETKELVQSFMNKLSGIIKG